MKSDMGHPVDTQPDNFSKETYIPESTPNSVKVVLPDV